MGAWLRRVRCAATRMRPPAGPLKVLRVRVRYVERGECVGSLRNGEGGGGATWTGILRLVAWSRYVRCVTTGVRLPARSMARLRRLVRPAGAGREKNAPLGVSAAGILDKPVNTSMTSKAAWCRERS